MVHGDDNLSIGHFCMGEFRDMGIPAQLVKKNHNIIKTFFWIFLISRNFFRQTAATSV
jgi:hypothetical protein